MGSKGEMASKGLKYFWSTTLCNNKVLYNLVTKAYLGENGGFEVNMAVEHD